MKNVNRISCKAKRPIGILFLLVALFPQFILAQFYETGQDPHSVKWKQIKTSNYKLIFPEGFENSAQSYAAVLDTFYPVSSKYLLKRPKSVSVIFHTQSSLSNGLVVYAPKRMELYTIPPQDNYPQDWLDQLALHETRHVVQLDALNHGFTKLGYYLLGEQAIGAVSGMVPRWFLEGDAVYSETMFSGAGRGRSASFLMPYRTLVLSKKKLFPYEKALLGSYKDFIPDIYEMGYPIVKMMRDSFDRNIFGKSLQYTARNPYLIFPFGHSLKKNSGLNNRFSYEYTFSTLKKNWEVHETYETYSRWTVKEDRTFTSYNFPIVVLDSLLLTQKWSLSETRNYSIIDKKGNEKKLVTVGSNSGERISFYGQRLTWSENKTDLRWQNRTYSEVMIYDIASHHLKRLTKRTWYFSPAFSPNGKYIAVIEETPRYSCSLVVIDASSGKVINKTSAPEGNHLQSPLWLNNNEIICLSVNKSGKSLIKLNGNIWTTVLAPSLKNITSFCLVDSTIVISGENNGINNLFVYTPLKDSYSQITHSRFGAFEPSYDTNNHVLYFSEYTSKGYRIASVPWTPENYIEISSYSKSKIPGENSLSSDFNIQSLTKEVTKYPVNNYSRFSHLLNVHSWIPVYYDYNVSDIKNPNVYPGLQLLSQDLLGTMVSSFGYSYEQGYSHVHTNITYKALMPIISWSLNVGGKAERVGGSANIPTYYSTNIISTVDISLPLNFSQGKIASGLTPYLEWKYNRYAYFIQSENRYYQGLSFFNMGMNYYRYRKMAIRDMYPKIGFSSFFKMQSTPFENKAFSEIYAFSYRQYFPGFFKNHSFQIRYAYQYQSPLRYLYSTMIAFPAGYSSTRTEELHLLNVNYVLPLIYPDIHAGPIFYLKRIRANIFYDIASNKYHAYNQPHIISHDILRSVGADIIADIHFLRIMFPFQVGARVAYLPNEKSFFTQAIFSVNLVY